MPAEKQPDARLLSAIPYLRPGDRVADVGTDHAYLPIYLVRQGIASAVLASDVNRGPIERAREHIREAGLSDSIQTLQADGLHGVESFKPDSILIFGMGGELIVKILSEAPWIRNSAIRLILQPMSRAAVLRAWLNENGFTVIGETLTFADQYYQTVCAEWTGNTEPYTALELLIGKSRFYRDAPYPDAFIEQKIRIYSAIVAGKKRSAGAETAAETQLLADLRALLARLRAERGTV